MRRFLPLFIVLTLLLVGLFLLLRNPSGETTMRKQQPDVTVEAAELYRQFVTDEAAANEQYLNKIIAVSGTVASVAKNSRGNISVILQTDDPARGVKCRLDFRSHHPRIEFRKGENVTFKGVCTGYVGDVELVQCVEN